MFKYRACQVPSLGRKLREHSERSFKAGYIPAKRLLLGGSGVVISRVISPLIWVITIVTLLITLLILGGPFDLVSRLSKVGYGGL